MTQEPSLPRLRAELMAMAAEDLRVRRELEQAGKLEEGYNWAMEIVHRANAARLKQLIAERGWPGKSLVGEDGAEAAWLILQHAISEPELQRSCVCVLQAAVEAGNVPPWQLAYLEDRIAYFEGRPQKYGTQFDHDGEGYLAPWTLLDPARVNDRRASVGLGPLEEHLVPREKQQPLDLALLQKRKVEGEQWAKRVGWRK